MIEGRGRRQSHLTTPLTGALGLLIVGTAALAARCWLERRRHEVVERALHNTNVELESFSYSVSHDLRAPLRSIDGFSQALVEDAGPLLDEESRRHLERIRGAARRMGLLIDDLLTLSKVTRAEMKRERVDVTEIATQIAAELARLAPTRAVAVTVAPELTATGDAQLVRLALQNLIENAWKFTSRRSQASIEVGPTKDGDGAPAFYVRDNGAGYDPNFATKLFGPFQRLHPASDFPGSGIGLATVKRIVHRHGGHVWAEGKIDTGACFYFTLS